MKKIFLLPLFIALLHEAGFAQCSDAGVCVLGRRQQVVKHQLSLNYLYGKGGKEDMLMFHSVRFDGEFQIFDQSRLSFSIPFSFQAGPLGSTNGIGDLSVVWSQTVFDDKMSRLGVQVGGKFATGEVNAGNQPQAYQSGLGTNDFLIGVTYEHDSWNGALAYQLSRGRSNNNPTRLKRGDDLLIRAGYKFSLQPVTVIGEVLAIKRLQESSVINLISGQPSSFRDVPGSDQFQINLVGRALYPLNDDYNLQAQLALPLRNREINVDGLTRSISLAIGFTYLF
ncbi:MAG: hypothetical protein AABZ61_00535 [Bacteroidota bacterium]